MKMKVKIRKKARKVESYKEKGNANTWACHTPEQVPSGMKRVSWDLASLHNHLCTFLRLDITPLKLVILYMRPREISGRVVATSVFPLR